MEAALAELFAVGQAEFTMEGVARRGFYAIGTVYERWPDKGALLQELAVGPISDSLTAFLAGMTNAQSACAAAMRSGDNERTLALVGEVLLAAHTTPRLQDVAADLWVSLRTGLQRWMGPGMSWYGGTTALGNALLGLLDIRGPGDESGWVRLLSDACQQEDVAMDLRASGVRVTQAPVPGVPLPSRQDPVATALIEAARSLLNESGAAGTTTREIAASAGVTTGALYRRYEGKSTLLADVLLAQLEPERYAWTWNLIAGLATDDPYSATAEVMAQRMIDVSEDLPAQRVLLQVGIAARNEPGLRGQVAERIDVAMQARQELVSQFIDLGLVRDDVDPAAYAWAFQTLPVGNRAILPLGFAIDAAEARSAMRAIMAASATEI